MIESHLASLGEQQVPATDEYRPLILRPQTDADLPIVSALLGDPQVEVHDTLLTQLGELVRIRQPWRQFSTQSLATAVRVQLDGATPAHYGVWAYYPWARRVVHLLDEPDFIAVRTSRNQYKITPSEQHALAAKRVGVIGLSVGQTIAIALAMGRSCGEIRLADFDTLELSNLNRVRSGVATLGLPKAVVTAREIAELDPFLRVTCFLDGITETTIDPFLTEGGALDLLIEVCDSLDIKVLARQRARAAGIPVLMHTSDRGMLDVERFDREPERPLLHGLIEHLDFTTLKDLTAEEKVPYILAMLGIDTVSQRLKASMLEVEHSIPTWPQLADAVMLGGAAVSDSARRILLDQFRDSGRFFLDLAGLIADNSSPRQAPVGPAVPEPPPPLSAQEMVAAVQELGLPEVPSAQRLDCSQVIRLVEAATSAPSGGNTQPWQWLHQDGRLYLFRDPSRGSFLDVASTASYLALGAAAENLILQAHALGLHVRLQPVIAGEHPLVAAFTFAWDPHDLPGREPQHCAHLAGAIPLRATTRTLGPRASIDPAKLHELQQTTQTVPGARLALLTSESDLDDLASIAAAAERLRLLNPAGHRDFVGELRWTPTEARATRDGIDLATVDLSQSERAGLSVARSWQVVAAVKQWGGGRAFEQLTRKTVDAASCVALLTMPTWSARAFFDGGRAMQRFWLAATQLGIAVQPVSSATFLFARLLHAEGAGLDPATIGELQELRRRFVALFPTVVDQRGELLLLRLAVAERPQTLALRRPVEQVLTFGDDPMHRRMLLQRFTLTGLACQLPLMISLAERRTAPRPALQSAYNALINHVRDAAQTDTATDRVEVTVMADGTSEATTAATMLTYGYCSRYYTGGSAPDLPPEATIPDARTYTLVAKIRVRNHGVVIGTLQAVVGPTVPALSLFEPAQGTQPPHFAAAGSGGDTGFVGELRRFSVSPIFECVPAPVDPLNVMLRDWRSQIYRGLYLCSLRLFRAMGVRFVYGIATPEIYRFFTKSGMTMRRLDELVLADSTEVRTLQRQFACYWRPQLPKEQQPAPYQILLPSDDRQSPRELART
jgi:molybdopterin/thiamine biosynthesis adenylyltransferase/nitroreductase